MNMIVKHKDVIILSIGTILVVFSFALLMYDKYELLKDNVFNEIELLKYREINKNDDSNSEQTYQDGDLNGIDNLDVSNVDEENVTPISKTEQNKIKKEYIGYLEISKINLKQGLVSKNSYYNNVNRNIQMLSTSDYPDKDRGNVILASHSGSSSISYFKNLYKLSVDDEAKIYYKGNIYTYKIVNIYNVPKVGTINIIRDVNKTGLTLITCTKGSKTEQTVYILELTSKEAEV